MEAADVTTIFNMHVKDGVLTPCGVTFLLHEAVKQTTPNQGFHIRVTVVCGSLDYEESHAGHQQSFYHSQ